MKRCLLAFCLIIAGLAVSVAAQAQIDMTLSKSGSDLVISWTGGTGPFAVIRSDSPSMTTRTVTLAANATSPITDAGALADGAQRHYYAVVETSAAPSVAVDSPAAGYTSQTPCKCASGTSTGATHVYVNTIEATGTDTWTACPDNTGVPLAVQSDTRRGGGVAIIASAVNASGDWSYVVVAGSYTGTISDQTPCKERGRGQ